MKSIIENECTKISDGFLALRTMAADIEKAAEIWIEAVRSGGKILFCGNGGSAADAQHLAAELTGRYEMERRAIAAIALTTDTSALTAISNDYSFQEAFARQVEALAKPGDVLFAISTSGNSANVLAAVRKAKSMGVRTIGLTGRGGGALVELCDLTLGVPADRANHIQEMHIAVGHMLCGLLEKALYG